MCVNGSAADDSSLVRRWWWWVVRNTKIRFSNGNTVGLDDDQATLVLDIIRDLYQHAVAGTP